MLNEIIRYFDLQSKQRSTAAIGHAAGTTHAPVIPQYFAVAAGVIAEPFLRTYIQSGDWDLNWRALAGRVIFGLLIAIVLLPAAYKSAFDPSKPVLVQLAALFPVGIGWQSLFTAATKIPLG